MIKAITDTIYKIDVPLPDTPLKSLNAYCIKGQDRHLLIDTGFNHPQCFEALTAALDELGIERRRLDILVTHMHADHSGLAPRLAKEASGTVWCSVGDGEGINNFAGVIDEEARTYFANRMVPHGFSRQQFKELIVSNPAIKYASPHLSFMPVKDGDELRYGGYVLRVIKTPGHTPDHITLYDAERKLFFAGDHILGSITPNITRWPGVRDSLGNYLNSLAKISRLDIALALPGHRAQIENTQERIQQIEAHHARRLAEVQRILADGPANAYTVASRMIWEMRYPSWEDFPMPQKWFATGEALAHLDRLVVMGEAEEQTRDGGAVVFARK
ncbi:MAG TPA: MBL fold metallo-hydrolase [Desulfobulbaceae bacterium]|nr:MBL fold metallo-hydrolase [Desulfobulbaceae bacterium]